VTVVVEGQGFLAVPVVHEIGVLVDEDGIRVGVGKELAGAELVAEDITDGRGVEIAFVDGHACGQAAFVLVAAEIGDDVRFAVAVLVPETDRPAEAAHRIVIAELHIDIPVAVDRNMARPADAVSNDNGLEAAREKETTVVLISGRERRRVFFYAVAALDEGNCQDYRQEAG
jgi:hypothetical protein